MADLIPEPTQNSNNPEIVVTEPLNSNILTTSPLQSPPIDVDQLHILRRESISSCDLVIDEDATDEKSD